MFANKTVLIPYFKSRKRSILEMSSANNNSHHGSNNLHQHLEKMAAPLDAEQIPARLTTWLRCFDRGNKVEHADSRLMHLSPMHVAGMHLSCQLHDLAPEAYTAFDLQSEVYDYAPRLKVHAGELHEMTWQHLQDLVAATQQQFNADTLYSSLDLGMLLICILCRAGFFVAHKWPVHGDAAEKLILPHMSLDNTRHAHISASELAQFFDCIHTVGSLCLAKTEAVTVCNTTLNENASKIATEVRSALTNHHREVSLDTFYEISMVHDLFPGSIAQYMHRHQEVFHSISQVVYFNWPAYARQKQQQFAQIMDAPDCLHVLPLLTEMYPDIPVLYEHTGAFNVEVHAKYDLAWVVMSGWIALVTQKMNIFEGSNPIAVLAHAIGSLQ